MGNQGSRSLFVTDGKESTRTLTSGTIMGRLAETMGMLGSRRIGTGRSRGAFLNKIGGLGRTRRCRHPSGQEEGHGQNSGLDQQCKMG